MAVTMATKKNQIGKQRIHCLNCKHLGITWNPTTPYFCRAWSIRSRRYPCEEVFSASGLQCQKFEQKAVVENAPKKAHARKPYRHKKSRSGFVKKV
ncbi:hypothetical protein [Thermodesulforhabdus norvegica]|uniref:Uracil-DNA glycosylase n=1 Tax=Thermodesulforhabdus norvegica TaxID=39841 RepID=A0A1I4UNE1_9BACT|nr:hypothetical protein [Thermodesulforhabdus norvegica]SFM90504.1 hypothetical protein SAMN05660836_01895 [Thermodesulforhabdus norvegica]